MNKYLCVHQATISSFRGTLRTSTAPRLLQQVVNPSSSSWFRSSRRSETNCGCRAEKGGTRWPRTCPRRRQCLRRPTGAGTRAPTRAWRPRPRRTGRIPRARTRDRRSGPTASTPSPFRSRPRNEDRPTRRWRRSTVLWTLLTSWTRFLMKTELWTRHEDERTIINSLVWVTECSTMKTPNFRLSPNVGPVGKGQWIFQPHYLWITSQFWTTWYLFRTTTVWIRTYTFIDYRCEDGSFLVSASCVTISNPDLPFQQRN